MHGHATYSYHMPRQSAPLRGGMMGTDGDLHGHGGTCCMDSPPSAREIAFMYDGPLGSYAATYELHVLPWKGEHCTERASTARACLL